MDNQLAQQPPYEPGYGPPQQANLSTGRREESRGRTEGRDRQHRSQSGSSHRERPPRERSTDTGGRNQDGSPEGATPGVNRYLVQMRANEVNLFAAGK